MQHQHNGTMAANFTDRIQNNMITYKSALERIIDKYSRQEYQNGREFDIENLRNLPDIADVPLRFEGQGVTRNSPVDLTLSDDGANEASVSSVSTQFSSEDDYGTTAKEDPRQLTLSPMYESSRNSSLLGLQPEDVDDELDMTFRSRGCQLADLYPGMVDRMKQACSRQHKTEAANSVLRRYRRWRQQPGRSSSNDSSARSERSDRSLIVSAQSPLKAATNQKAWPAVECSPGRVRRLHPQPITVIDLTGVSESSKSTQVPLNETFDVPEQPRPCSTLDFGPSRLRRSPELTLRSKRLFMAAANGNCMTVTDTTSPVRQSPLKSKMPMIFTRSPHAYLRSPGFRSTEGVSREPKRQRSMSESLTAPAHMPLRGFCLQNPSPKRSASTSDPRRIGRNLSLDSFLPVKGSSWSHQQLDDEFIKLYHRFVCQNKASFQHVPPCRFCARGGEVGRGHSTSSSSALAALALSPHRSLLRKRHREMSWESHPQSKRLRDECYASSPGSKRYVKEMQRRRVSPSEQPGQSACDRIAFNPRRFNLLSRFNKQPQKF